MLKQTLQSDQILALKAGEKDKLQVIRYIVAQLKYKEIEKQTEITDEDVIATIRKLIKELKESIESAKQANRLDLIDENQKQIDIMSEYLPPEMSDSDLGKAIDEIVEANKAAMAANAKAIIGIVMGKLRSKVDPARIQALMKAKNLM